MCVNKIVLICFSTSYLNKAYCILLYKKSLLNLVKGFKTTNIYLTVLVGRELRTDLTGKLWLKGSREFLISIVPGLKSSEGSAGAEAALPANSLAVGRSHPPGPLHRQLGSSHDRTAGFPQRQSGDHGALMTSSQKSHITSSIVYLAEASQ